MIALVFATRREAEPILERLGIPALEEGATVRFAFGGTSGLIAVSGMGLVEATRTVRRLIVQQGATRVVNAGISGAVADGIESGRIYRITEVRERGSAPSPEEALVEPCDPGSWEALPTASLSSSDEPVFDLRERIQAAAWGDLVDMEGAAVARECRARGIPCTLLKGVSDRAGPGGRTELQQAIGPVSRRLAEVIIYGLGQKAPPGLLNRCINFIKVEHTIFSLPLILVGAWLGAGRRLPSWRVLLLVALAGAGARTVGMAMNRILDRDLDAANPRTAERELPSGRLGLGSAWGVVGIGLGAYLLACWLLGPLCLLLSPLPLIPLLAYSRLKRFTSLCHFGIGVCLAQAPLAAFIAGAGHLRFDRAVLLLSTFTFFWISGFDIIYGLQDEAFDRRAGVHSLPARLGSLRAQWVAAACHGVALAAALGLLGATGGGVLAWTALGVTAGTLVAANLPLLPLPTRFFPLSAVAGVAGALIPILGAS